MPEEGHPEIDCFHWTAPSNAITVNRYPDEQSGKGKSHCHAHRTVWQTDKKGQNGKEGVNRLGNEHIPAAPLTREQPGKCIRKRDAKRCNREPPKNGRSLLPLRPEKDKS